MVTRLGFLSPGNASRLRAGALGLLVPLLLLQCGGAGSSGGASGSGGVAPSSGSSPGGAATGGNATAGSSVTPSAGVSATGGTTGSAGLGGGATGGDGAGDAGEGGAGNEAGPFVTRLDNFDTDATGRQLTRFDTDGNAVDAHDGELAFFDGLYYLYGTSYDCGYQWGTPGAPFCGFKSYSSPDLVHFTDRGALFDASTPTWQTRCDGSSYGCYRPHVVFNAATKEYVLWVNVYDNSVGFRVFTSSTPAGPFVEVAEPKLVVNGTAPVAGLNNGDHDTFVDDDGQAYVAFTDWRSGGRIAIERLDASYLSGTGAFVEGVTPANTEAPALFKRNGVYYLTYSDPNCGYCAGTGTSYRTAASPLGPWSAPKKLSDDSCGGQPSFVATLPLSTGAAYLYASDLWNRAAKNEALANFFWAPLSFDADGAIAPLKCEKSVELSLASGSAGSQRSLPNVDVDAGVAGFTSFCDVHGAIQRAQAFVPTRSGTLQGVGFTTFQDGNANAGLTLAIYAANADQPAGSALFSKLVPESPVGFSARELLFALDIPVTAGARYLLVISSTATAGCFGVEYNDDPKTSIGGAAYSNDSGATFKAEAGRSLKFRTLVSVP